MPSDIFRDSIFWVEVERISPNPYQPRREFDPVKLQELADSIRMYGLLQPLTVTRREIPREDGGLSVEYELVAGERRLRASKLAGLHQVPVIIRVGEETDQMKLELAIIENLQREDLNPVDRARAFERLCKEFHFTHLEVGKKVGRSREYVTNTLRLLLLPEDILQHLSDGKISEGHTRPLLMLKDRPEEQATLAREILLKKLNVRETESVARRVAQDKVTARYRISPDILSLERTLTERLGTRVTIEPREVGGRVVISFFSPDDLQTLLESIRVADQEVAAEDIFKVLSPDCDVSVNDVIEEMRAPEEDAESVDEMRSEQGAAVDEAVPLAPDITLPTVSSVEASEQEPTSVSENIDAAMVVASPLRPLPETVDDLVHGIQTKPADEVEVVVTQSPERPMPKESGNDESDLYSIRNFSI